MSSDVLVYPVLSKALTSNCSSCYPMTILEKHFCSELTGISCCRSEAPFHSEAEDHPEACTCCYRLCPLPQNYRNDDYSGCLDRIANTDLLAKASLRL